MNFTHLYVDGFGWENTIYQPKDFDRVEKHPYYRTMNQCYVGWIGDKQYVLLDNTDKKSKTQLIR